MLTCGRSTVRILKKFLKIFGITLAGSLALVLLVLVVARFALNGPRLGRLVSDFANDEIMGRIDIGAIEWTLPFGNIVTGNPWALAVRAVEVHDDQGKLVAHVDDVKVALDMRAILTGRVRVTELSVGRTLANVESAAGFAADAFKPRKPPKPKKPKKPKKPGEIDTTDVEVRNAHLGPIEVHVGLSPKMWIDVQGFEATVGVSIKGEQILVDLRPRIPHATFATPTGALTIEDLHAPFGIGFFEGPEAGQPKTAAKRPDDLYVSLAGKLGGADLDLSGALLGIMDPTPAEVRKQQASPRTGMDLHLELQHVAGLLDEVRRAFAVPVGLGGTPEALVRVHVHSTKDDPIIADAHLEGLGATVPQKPPKPPIKASHLLADATYKSGHGDVTVDLKRVDVPGGKLAAKAELRLETGAMAAQVWPDLDPGPLAVQGGLGRVFGVIKVRGLLDVMERLEVEEMDLKFVRGRSPKIRQLPRAAQIALRAQILQSLATLRSLSVKAGSLDIQSKATADLDAKRGGTLGAGLRLFAPDLAPMFDDLGLEHFAKSATIDVKAGGTLFSPKVQADLVVLEPGFRQYRADKLTARATYDGHTAGVDGLDLAGFGGHITGKAQAALGKGSPGISADLALDHIDLARVELAPPDPKKPPLLSGLVSGTVTARGHANAPDARVSLRIPKLVATGERISNVVVEARLRPDGVAVIDQVALTRDAGGGVAIAGTYGTRTGDLDVKVKLAPLPIQSLAQLAKVPAQATVSADLSVTGNATEKDFRPRGTLDILGAKFRELALGDGHIQLATGADGIQIHGALFDRVWIDGTVQPFPKLAGNVRLQLRNVHAEDFQPELKNVMNLSTALSAVVDVALADGTLQFASVTIPDLRLGFDGETQDGSIKRLEVRNEQPIRIALDGPTQVVTISSLRLTGDAGTIAVEGQVGPLDSKASVSAALDLGIVEYLARAGLASSRGKLLLEAQMSGPMAAPKVAAVLEFKGAELLPQGFAEAVRIAGGRIEVQNRQDGKALAAIRALRIQIAGGELQIGGTAKLSDQWEPGQLDAGIIGEIPAKIAEIAAPAAVSDTSGALGITATVGGTAKKPELDGSIQIPLSGIDLRVRKFAQLRLAGGKISFNSKQIGLDNIQAKIDDGSLAINGSIDFKDNFKVDNIDVRVVGREVPYRIPGTLFVSVSPTLSVRGDLTGLLASGRVDIVECEVTQQVDFSQILARKGLAVTGEATGPKRKKKGKEGPNPLLAATELEVHVASPGGIVIRNNLADMRLDANLDVLGTAEKPALEGNIRFVQGGFKIPFWQGRFDRTSGTITFSQGGKLGEDTPTFDIHAENDLIDANEVQHLVVLEITGKPKPSPFLNLLTTNTGLNRGQTLTLLTTKRAPTDLRNEIRTSQGGGGTAVADQAVKDLMSAPLNDLLGPAAQSLMKTLLFGFTADVNFAIGPESAEMVIKKRFNRYLSARGRIVLGLVGRGRQEARGDLRLHDDLGGLVLFERRVRGDGTEDEAKSVLKTQLLFQHRFLK